MIDFKSLRKGLQITSEELATIRKNTGLNQTRLTLVEHGVVALSPEEESILRTAISYTMHCRSTRLLAKVGQEHFDNSQPLTWDEYQKTHQSSTMPKQMNVIAVSVDLAEDDGRLLFPLSEPIPWHVELNDGVVKLLATCPEVLESMISGIRTAVAVHRESL